MTGGRSTGVYIDTNFVYHGYLRSPEGKIVTVDPIGSTFTFPDGINNLGVTTGVSVDTNNVSHGFLRLPGLIAVRISHMGRQADQNAAHAGCQRRPRTRGSQCQIKAHFRP